MRRLIYAASGASKPLHFCRGCGDECDYEYCDDCAKTKTCHHGKVINDGCPQCDYEGDLAFDAARERGR